MIRKNSKSIGIALIVGILLFTAMLIYSVRTDRASAKEKLEGNVQYVREQCANYSKYGIPFERMLAGLSMDLDGTIVLSSEGRIIASNDEGLLGEHVSNVPVLQNISQLGQVEKLVTVKTKEKGPNHCLGMLSMASSYQIYAFMPEKNVFVTTLKNMIFITVCYILVLFMIQLIRVKTAQRYQEEQHRKEMEYQNHLKEAARRAESANVAKTEFLQRMSHDIRTPINGIRGMVKIGDHYDTDMEKQAECRKKIWEASGLLLELVNEVLDMGKLESGEIVLESRSFQIIDLAEEIQQVLEKTAAERGIQLIRKDWIVPHPYLIGSPLHVKRLLMNILSNAVKYNKEKGTVTLSCREVKCTKEMVWIEFICADTGIGMSEEYQKHLFEPFTQENEGSRSTYSGTGLGMAITKSLVDKMNGTIRFESQKDMGTTYYITIPFKRDLKGRAQAENTPINEKQSLNGMSVLLVEDNELNMEIAQFFLENAGAVVTPVWNGQEALETFQESDDDTYDAILMDIMMPVLDGYQATQAIRALPRPDAKKIPILAMTANAFAEDRKRAMQVGMNEHMAKPIQAEVLVDTLMKYKKEV